MPLQLANGPVSAEPGPRPLSVKLDGTRDTVHLRFHHPPRSGLLFDLDTGKVLWRHEPERVLPIASVTKMMTALIVVGREPPDAKVRITKEALAYKGSGVGVLPRGKRVKLETLLNGLLLPSGNDAAIALAQRVSGTVRNFVAAMNARAAEMGLRCTHYTSPDGFVDAGNHSCAVDLAAEARAVLDQPRRARRRVGGRRAGRQQARAADDGSRRAAPGARRRRGRRKRRRRRRHARDRHARGGRLPLRPPLRRRGADRLHRRHPAGHLLRR